MQTKVSLEGRVITVRVPLTFRRRGGRKLVLAPGGAELSVQRRGRIENSLVKALARAHRWKNMMESGQYASVTELATAEKINQSYLCRVLRMTLLAPDITEAILNGAQPASVQLDQLLTPFPIEWERQWDLIGTSRSATFAPVSQHVSHNLG